MSGAASSMPNSSAHTFIYKCVFNESKNCAVLIQHYCIHLQEACMTINLHISVLVCDKWDISLTFGPFQQVDLQNRLRWGLPPSDQQPHHWPRLLQGFHRPAVNHLGHVHVVHAEHAVIHPMEGKGFNLDHLVSQ